MKIVCVHVCARCVFQLLSVSLSCFVFLSGWLDTWWTGDRAGGHKGEKIHVGMTIIMTTYYPIHRNRYTKFIAKIYFFSIFSLFHFFFVCLTISKMFFFFFLNRVPDGEGLFCQDSTRSRFVCGSCTGGADELAADDQIESRRNAMAMRSLQGRLVAAETFFLLLIALLMLNVFEMFGHLALYTLRHSAHICEQRVQDVELFRQLFDAFLQTFVIAHQKFDFFFRFTRSQFGLFARFPHRDVVALATAAVLVRTLIGPFTSARSAGTAAATSAPFRRRRFAQRRWHTFDWSRTVARTQDFHAAARRRILSGVGAVVSRVPSAGIVRMLRRRTVRPRIQRFLLDQTAVRRMLDWMVLMLLLLLVLLLLLFLLLFWSINFRCRCYFNLSKFTFLQIKNNQTSINISNLVIERNVVL